VLALLAMLVLLPACSAHSPAEQYLAGLNQLRGLAFDDAGDLLIAAAGAPDPTPAGDTSMATNHSGQVLRISPDRQMTPVVTDLPFTHYGDGGTDVGAADVAVIGGTLYLLTGEGYGDLSRSVLRVTPDGDVQPIANLLNFATARSLEARMVGANAAPANPFAMVAAPDGRLLYVVDSASGRVLRVGLDGSVGVFAELPDAPPLTGLAFGPDGRLYFTDFSKLPHTPGSGAIWAADSSGKLVLAADNLTMPIDVGFDATGLMYVLEFGSGRRSNHPYAADEGRLLRIERDGSRAVVLDGLNYPTAMIFSRVGDLYLSVSGAFTTRGQGSIVKVACSSLGVPEACHA
jgi:sugar lactone lactonase YvrE